MSIEYFCAYHDLVEKLSPYSDAETGRLFMACLNYSRSGIEPQLCGNERFIWPSLKWQIDRDKDAYDGKCIKNANNGKKGGRPKKPENQTPTEKPNGYLENPRVFPETQKSQGKEEYKGKEEYEDNTFSPPVVGENVGAHPYDPELAKVMNLYLDRVNALPSSACIDELKAFANRLGADVCCHAINIALDDNKASWSYIRAILQSYHQDGIKTLGDVQRREAARQAQKERSRQPKPNQIAGGTPSVKPIDMDKLRKVVESM